RQKRGVVNLVSVQMQDGQHRTIANGIQEFADVPRSGQWSGFGLAVANHRSDDQVGVVERRATRMREHIAQFAPLVDRAGSLRRAVAADSARKGELSEELVESKLIFALFGINLGIRPLE